MESRRRIITEQMHRRKAPGCLSEEDVDTQHPKGIFDHKRKRSDPSKSYIEEMLCDDEVLSHLPLRHLDQWYLFRKPNPDLGYFEQYWYQYPFRRVPLPVDSMNMVNYVLVGMLIAPNDRDERVKVELDELEFYTIDNEEGFRGYFVVTSEARYWLRNPCTKTLHIPKVRLMIGGGKEVNIAGACLPSQECLHRFHRVQLGLLSNLTDLLCKPDKSFNSLLHNMSLSDMENVVKKVSQSSLKAENNQRVMFSSPFLIPHIQIVHPRVESCRWFREWQMTFCNTKQSREQEVVFRSDFAAWADARTNQTLEEGHEVTTFESKSLANSIVLHPSKVDPKHPALSFSVPDSWFCYPKESGLSPFSPRCVLDQIEMPVDYLKYNSELAVDVIQMVKVSPLPLQPSEKFKATLATIEGEAASRTSHIPVVSPVIASQEDRNAIGGCGTPTPNKAHADTRDVFVKTHKSESEGDSFSGEQQDVDQADVPTPQPDGIEPRKLAFSRDIALASIALSEKYYEGQIRQDQLTGAIPRKPPKPSTSESQSPHFVSAISSKTNKRERETDSFRGKKQEVGQMDVPTPQHDGNEPKKLAFSLDFALASTPLSEEDCEGEKRTQPVIGAIPRKPRKPSTFESPPPLFLSRIPIISQHGPAAVSLLPRISKSTNACEPRNGASRGHEQGANSGGFVNEFTNEKRQSTNNSPFKRECLNGNERQLGRKFDEKGHGQRGIMGTGAYTSSHETYKYTYRKSKGCHFPPHIEQYITNMVEDRARAKRSHDYEVCDAIKFELAARYGIDIIDYARIWGIRAQFTPEEKDFVRHQNARRNTRGPDDERRGRTFRECERHRPRKGGREMQFSGKMPVGPRERREEAAYYGMGDDLRYARPEHHHDHSRYRDSSIFATSPGDSIRFTGRQHDPCPKRALSTGYFAELNRSKRLKP